MSLKHSFEIENIGKLQSSQANNNLYSLYLIRFLVGAINVQVTRFIGRHILYKSIRYFLSLPVQKDLKKIIKTDFNLNLFFYFICYTCVSFSAIFTSFIIFDFLKLI